MPRRIGHIVYWGPFIFAFSRKGQMGYNVRWRHLRFISTHFKAGINRCDWCFKRPNHCHCWDGLDEYYATHGGS